MSTEYLARAAQAFCFAGPPVHFTPLSAGHINNTFLVDCGEGSPKYILQRVNTEVFPDPRRLMSNVKGVSLHIAGKVIQAGGNPRRMARTVVETKDKDDCYIDPDGGFWRAFLEIENVFSSDYSNDPKLLYASAVAFGRFLGQLSDYPAHLLYETIPDFHNTVRRFGDLQKVLAKDAMGRAAEMQDAIRFVLEREQDCSYIIDRIADGRLPLHVTHNDAKLSNVLLDRDTGEGVCVIDLDTVMPGSVLYDFGEAVRFGASSAREDEANLDRVEFRLDLFQVIARGFIGELIDAVTEEELRGLPMGAYLMALETGIRFLTDYLAGDVYFQIRYPKHNRDRARNQLKLAGEMEQNLKCMQEIVQRIYTECKREKSL